MKSNQEIGIVTVNYDSEGTVISATFKPTMEIEFDNDLLEQLRNTKSPTEPETVQQNAELALGAWFSKVNEIELADRELYDLVTEVVYCDKHDNGNVATCAIRFIFKLRVDVAN